MVAFRFWDELFGWFEERELICLASVERVSGARKLLRMNRLSLCQVEGTGRTSKAAEEWMR